MIFFDVYRQISMWGALEHKMESANGYFCYSDFDWLISSLFAEKPKSARITKRLVKVGTTFSKNEN